MLGESPEKKGPKGSNGIFFRISLFRRRLPPQKLICFSTRHAFLARTPENPLRATDRIGHEKGRFLEFRVFAAREKALHEPFFPTGASRGHPRSLFPPNVRAGGKRKVCPVAPPGRAQEGKAPPRRPTTRFRRRPRSHGHFFNRNRTRGAFSYFFPSPLGLARDRLHREKSACPKWLFLSLYVGAHTTRRTRFF